MNTISGGSNHRLVYIMRVLPIYQDAQIRIDGGGFYQSTAKPNQPVKFVNEQIGITATGRSGGVVYRTAEVIPVLPPYDRRSTVLMQLKISANWSLVIQILTLRSGLISRQLIVLNTTIRVVHQPQIVVRLTNSGDPDGQAVV